MAWVAPEGTPRSFTAQPKFAKGLVSPVLGPIEGAFSKVKALLMKAEARSFEALVEADDERLSDANGANALSAPPTAATELPRRVHFESPRTLLTSAKFSTKLSCGDQG